MELVVDYDIDELVDIHGEPIIAIAEPTAGTLIIVYLSFVD